MKHHMRYTKRVKLWSISVTLYDSPKYSERKLRHTMMPLTKQKNKNKRLTIIQNTGS